MSDYRILSDVIHSDLAASFRAIADEAPGAAWAPGRQGSGYSKYYLRDAPLMEAQRSFVHQAQQVLANHVNDGKATEHMDALLIRYPPGSSIPDHKDPAPEGFSHHRLNVLLSEPSGSGTLFIEGRPVAMSAGDAVVFSSGSQTHRVDAVHQGRLVLSVGILVPQ